MELQEPWGYIRGLFLDFAEYTLGFQRFLFPYFALHDHVHARNVARNAETLLDLHERRNEAVLTLLHAASFLHDIGMAIPPSVIDRLQLHESVVEAEAPGLLNQLKDELGEVYYDYFRNGVLRLSRGNKPATQAPYGYLDAYVVRKLHPWIGSLYVTNYLHRLLPNVSGDELLNRVQKAVAKLIMWHSGKVNPRQETCACGGYQVNLRELAILLRLADAMDFSRRRGAFVFEHIVDDMVEASPSQLKHWLFKLAVESVSLRRRDVVIEVDLRGDDLEVEGKLLGVLIFELASNFLPDFEFFTGNIIKVNLFVEVDGKQVSISPFTETLKKVRRCFKDINLQLLLRGSSEYIKGISNRLEKEVFGQTRDQDWYVKSVQVRPAQVKLANYFDFFDALAFALKDGRKDVLYNLLTLAKTQCPHAKVLLNEILRREQF